MFPKYADRACLQADVKSLRQSWLKTVAVMPVGARWFVSGQVKNRAGIIRSFSLPCRRERDLLSATGALPRAAAGERDGAVTEGNTFEGVVIHWRDEIRAGSPSPRQTRL